MKLANVYSKYRKGQHDDGSKNKEKEATAKINKLEKVIVEGKDTVTIIKNSNDTNRKPVIISKQFWLVKTNAERCAFFVVYNANNAFLS